MKKAKLEFDVKEKDNAHKITIFLPQKPTIEYQNVNITFKAVRDGIEQIQKDMLDVLQDDMKTIDNYKKQKSLHSVDFYWWLLGSYTVLQSNLINLITQCEGLAGLCMEVEKRLANGVPIDVQVQVPKELEKELKQWLSEREATKKAQRQYLG